MPQWLLPIGLAHIVALEENIVKKNVKRAIRRTQLHSGLEFTRHLVYIYLTMQENVGVTMMCDKQKKG